MSGVYALLYALVLSEDYALLLGAIVLFVALAAVMLVTRTHRLVSTRNAPTSFTHRCGVMQGLQLQ